MILTKKNKRMIVLVCLGAVIVICSILEILMKKEDKSEIDVDHTLETEIPIAESMEYVLENGLVVTEPMSYAGIYMEDGTDEVVEDVMMIILTNTNEKDLQLARISISYKEFVAEFEVTNLPSGEKVVLLEKNRHQMTEEAPGIIEDKNVVFFEERMSIQEDRFDVTGLEHAILLKNITDKDVTGDIYIYYKNSATDLLYGGITYRAKIGGGLAAGANANAMAAHFTPDTCKILAVTVRKSAGE